jgi:geranylgeranyl reductase family protein
MSHGITVFVINIWWHTITTMETYDVAVVGGGPVGGYVAQRIAHEGYTVALVEEHTTIGAPRKCAGLVSSRVFDFVTCPQEDFVQNKIYGARIHAPSGTTVSIGGDRVHAFAIDRSRFDVALVDQAQDDGAEIFLGSKMLSAQKTTAGIVLTAQQKGGLKHVSCNLVIGADGAHSKLRETLCFPQPAEMLQGIGAEAAPTTLDPQCVELFLGENIAPGFFAWIIPSNDNGTKARVGLCIAGNARYSAKQYFSAFLKHPQVSPFLGHAAITNCSGGSIPLGLLKTTVQAHVMLVGDAAAQVKPTSGGGVYTGLASARHCSKVALEALQKQNFTAKFLARYHKAWSDEIGREIQVGMTFRKIFTSLTDEQISRYVEKVNNQKILDVITEYGDIDYPSKLILPLVTKTPSLLKLLFHARP